MVAKKGAGADAHDLETEVLALKREPGDDLLAHGGVRFAQSLVLADLVDEYRLIVHPVALGKGLRLFPELAGPLRLRLVSATHFAIGAIAKVFRPA